MSMSHDATQPSSANEDSNTPQLDSLLSKLRPFQRAAFDFAVRDIPLDDGRADDKRTYRTKIGAERYNTNNHHDGEPSHRESVAGAGTGRILLGDEMGLG